MSPIPDQILAIAQQVAIMTREEYGVEIAYNEAGVAWLDRYISENRSGLHGECIDGLVITFGAFLGQCIVQTYGAEWVQEDGRWGLRLEDGSRAFPFEKTRSQLENGDEDSVLSFFQMIPILSHIQ